uniref:40S ribosomal protein S25 n=1 Tax=Caenorhabditis japonica TaxID=281687 RepID=A0A8R1IQD4_CAEJA
MHPKKGLKEKKAPPSKKKMGSGRGKDKKKKTWSQSRVSERLKERASLVKAGLKELQAKGLFVHHHEHVMYTGTTKEADVIVE